jgi:hypothetical protein
MVGHKKFPSKGDHNDQGAKASYQKEMAHELVLSQPEEKIPEIAKAF